MKNLTIILACLFLSSTFSCHKDSLEAVQKVHVTFKGRIENQNGYGLNDIWVSAGNQDTHTAGYGDFELESVKLPSNNAILRISQNGYYDFSRAYYVRENAIQTVEIQLISKVQVGSFDNASGGVVNIPGGPSLTFPPNATSASGTIRVFAYYFNPADENLGLHMPGDLRGINAAGEERALASYGMIVAELENSQGPVTIAAGKEVELSMPIVSAQQAKAPDQIALWYYDLTKARWIEEGTAQKTGNRYVGKVSHFSFWNCDIGFPLVELSGRICTEDEQHGLAGAWVQVTTTLTEWPGGVATDSEGYFTGSVIADAEMELEVFTIDPCGNQLSQTQIIGPFQADAQLPTIVLDGPNIEYYTISGRLVDCSGTPVTTGYISLDGRDSLFINGNGTFSYELLRCSAPSNVVFQGFDLGHLTQSDLQTIVLQQGGPDIYLGDQQVCVEVDEYFECTLDGQQHSILDGSSYVVDGAQGGEFVHITTGNGKISLHLANPGQAGTYPLTALYLFDYHIGTPQAAGITTTISQFATTDQEYFIGTFQGSFTDDHNVSHSLSGSYKVKRSN